MKEKKPSRGSHSDLTNRLRKLEETTRRLQRENDDLQLLNSLSTAVAASFDPREAAFILRRKLEGDLNVCGGCVLTNDPVSNNLVLQELWGCNERRVIDELIRGWNGLEGVSMKKPLAVNLEEFLASGLPIGGWRWGLYVPLIAFGASQGLVILLEKKRFSRDRITFFEAFGPMVGSACRFARMFEQISAARERTEMLSSRIVQIQETERRHIARELHDEVGSLLTGLKLLLEAPLSRIDSSIEDARQLVSELMSKVRQLSLDLRPGMLDDLGLLPALLWYLDRFTSQTKVSVKFVHTSLEGVRFSQPAETAAFRIIQEALTNAARHARVSEVSVAIWLDADLINLEVADQGAGFDPAAVLGGSQSSGVAGMGERARMLGGGLTIESRPGEGTRITASLPV